MNDQTRLIHSGRDRDPHTGASSIPIYQVSTFDQPDPENLGAYDYARSDNPTRERLGINDRLLRLSIGIEDVRDLIRDLEGVL